MAAELTAVKEYKDPSVLDAASKLLFHFNRIPRLNIRLECHFIAFSWRTGYNAAAAQITTIVNGLQELKRDQRILEQLLAIILSVGNYVNGDSARGQVKIPAIQVAI